MANTASAKKQILVSERKTVRNKTARTATKTAVKKAEAAIKAKAPDATAALQSGQSALDKAAKTGIIHPKNAARKKSRLAKKLAASKIV